MEIAMIALIHLPAFFSSHSALMPIIGLGCSGFALALLQAPKDAIRQFGITEAESIMNFSSLGTLRCICGTEHGNPVIEDRRQFCRSCGCEVLKVDPAMYEKPLTRKEIKAMTRNLRNAAIRSRNMELPPSITSIDELNAYLATTSPNDKLPPPSRPTTVEQPQVH
jgi:hypothetical protein